MPRKANIIISNIANDDYLLTTLDDCPFCGGHNFDVVTFDVSDREGYPTQITCSYCGASGPWDYSAEKNMLTVGLVDLWNSRVKS